ncbi:glycerol-3-phosphate responsive antiterminator [Ferviditalea candida]|uniref:glycerol-3-phosphate responsive antiterminator n=1 Tax=Ferviditalea candida TaxID=3108399 RepID=UPI003FA387EE
MKMSDFYERLERHRIIASVKNFKSLDKALESQVGAAVLSIGNIGVIKQYVDLFKARGIPVFFHMERIGGISYDI